VSDAVATCSRSPNSTDADYMSRKAQLIDRVKHLYKIFTTLYPSPIHFFVVTAPVDNDIVTIRFRDPVRIPVLFYSSSYEVIAEVVVNQPEIAITSARLEISRGELMRVLLYKADESIAFGAEYTWTPIYVLTSRVRSVVTIRNPDDYLKDISIYN